MTQPRCTEGIPRRGCQEIRGRWPASSQSCAGYAVILGLVLQLLDWYRASTDPAVWQCMYFHEPFS